MEATTTDPLRVLAVLAARQGVHVPAVVLDALTARKPGPEDLATARTMWDAALTEADVHGSGFAVRQLLYRLAEEPSAVGAAAVDYLWERDGFAAAQRPAAPTPSFAVTAVPFTAAGRRLPSRARSWWATAVARTRSRATVTAT